MMLESIHNLPEVALLLISTYVAIRGTTPPHIATESDRGKVKKDSISAFTSLTSGFHSALIISSAFQSKVLLQNPLGPGSNFNDSLKTKFIVANIVQILGGLLRLKCYSTLREFFTFKLAVRKGHKIIDTGPYSFVRHPSYTAMMFLVPGIYTAHLSFNPYLHETRPTGFLLSNARSIIAATGLVTAVLLHLRIRDEEEMLSSSPELGAQYQNYMKRVRSRLIPLVY